MKLTLAPLMPATSPSLTSIDFGLEAALLAPAQIHAQQHLRPVLRFGAAGARLDVEEALCESILPGNMRWNSSFLTSLLERADVALDSLRGGLVVLLDGHVEQLAGLLQAVGDAIERADDLLQARALAAELLRLVRRVPDGGIFELAPYFGQPFALEVVLKETS